MQADHNAQSEESTLRFDHWNERWTIQAGEEMEMETYKGVKYHRR